MTNKMEEELKLLRDKLEAVERQGNNITIISGEGKGNSSCKINKTSKGEKTYELKVYSNDLGGANEAVERAIVLAAEQLDTRLNGADHD